MSVIVLSDVFFFFNDTATTEIYTLSLHDALPICRTADRRCAGGFAGGGQPGDDPEQRPKCGVAQDAEKVRERLTGADGRSEEHTSELQSQSNLVCRLLLEKKKYDIHHIDLR